MEGLRGFAVLLVFLVHYASVTSPWVLPGDVTAVVFELVHDIGQAGVDLFFVLSGQLIYSHLIRKPQPFGPYFMRRLWRIYPTFLFVFALYVLLCFALPGQNKLPAEAGPAALYLLQNLLLLPGLLPIDPLITVAWSLSYEVFYYLAMPGVIAIAALRRRSPEARMVVVSGLLLVGLAAAALWGGPVRMALFLAGVLVAEATQRLPRSRVGTAAALPALAAVAGVMALPMPGPALQALRTVVLCGAFFILCVACFGSPGTAVARTFGFTPLRWLGNMSYAYYLIHGLTLNALFIGVAMFVPPGDQTPVALAMLLPAFVVTLAVAAALFLLLEKPFSLRTHGGVGLAALPVAAVA